MAFGGHYSANWKDFILNVPRKKEYTGVSSKWDHRPLLNSKPDHLYKMNMSPTVYIMPDVFC